MADEKKPDAKAPAPAPVATPTLFGPHPDPFVEIVWNVLVLLIIVYFINAIVSYINSIFSSSGSNLSNFWNDIVLLLWKIFSYLKYILIALALALIWFIVSYYRKLMAVRKEEAERLYPKEVQTKEEVNPRWKQIIDNVMSVNESDWRLAILEADIILAEVLDNLGLPGEIMADKLKAADKNDFKTIDNAWEAHKIRNQVAHQGSAFHLDQREASRVVGLYESVFKEFEVI